MDGCILGPPLLLVVGDGPTKWDDLERFWRLKPPRHAICCLNRAGLVYPCSFELWWSVHPEALVEWARECPGAWLWSCRPFPGVFSVWVSPAGGSGLSVLYAAQAWGYHRVVLAGVPLTGPYRAQFERPWRKVAASLRGYARSLSGLTRELLGFPTRRWMDGEKELGMPPRKIEPANVGNIIGENGPELIVSASVDLVAMKRDPEFYDAPHTASVHPDEVKNYQAAGWVPADVKE